MHVSEQLSSCVDDMGQTLAEGKVSASATCRLSGSWMWMMSLRVKGVSSRRSFQFLGLMLSSSTA